MAACLRKINSDVLLGIAAGSIAVVRHAARPSLPSACKMRSWVSMSGRSAAERSARSTAQTPLPSRWLVISTSAQQRAIHRSASTKSSSSSSGHTCWYPSTSTRAIRRRSCAPRATCAVPSAVSIVAMSAASTVKLMSPKSMMPLICRRSSPLASIVPPELSLLSTITLFRLRSP